MTQDIISYPSTESTKLEYLISVQEALGYQYNSYGMVQMKNIPPSSLPNFHGLARQRSIHIPLWFDVLFEVMTTPMMKSNYLEPP
jgi:hypothetical protein